MQHVQRVVLPVHVDACDGPPGAADKEQPVALRSHLVQKLGHDLLDIGAPSLPAAGDFAQLQRTQGRGDAPPDLTALDFRQFQR